MILEPLLRTDLEAKLRDSQTARLRLIVSDGVFSMDGNVCPLPEIVDLARRYNALVFLDECHATGFFGATGRCGSRERCTTAGAGGVGGGEKMREVGFGEGEEDVRK